MQQPFNVPFRGLFYPFFLGCICLLCSFGSCERDREPRPSPVPACRVTRWHDPTDAIGSVVHTYDAQHRLVALHHVQNGNAFFFWTFAYNERNQLTQRNFAARQDAPVTVTFTYRYNAQGQLTGWVEMQNGRQTEATRELDAEGNCTHLTVVATDRGSGVRFTTRHSYQYRDGDLVSSITDMGTAVERRHTYEYYPEPENKLRAYETLVGSLDGTGATPSRHLVKTARFVGTHNPATDIETRQYTYEYNAKGFPTRLTAVSTHADTTSTTNLLFEYNCD